MRSKADAITAWKNVHAVFNGSNVYYEIFNEPFGYKDAATYFKEMQEIYEGAGLPNDKVVLDGTGYADSVAELGKLWSGMMACESTNALYLLPLSTHDAHAHPYPTPSCPPTSPARTLPLRYVLKITFTQTGSLKDSARRRTSRTDVRATLRGTATARLLRRLGRTWTTTSQTTTRAARTAT